MDPSTLQRPPTPTAQPPKTLHLGTLSTLPSELRNQVFLHCIGNRSVGILRASKQLCGEFIPLLYEEFKLVFHVDPTDPLSRVRILNQNGRVVECLPYHRDTVLDKMPIDRFKSIRILVDAPDPQDPGQLLRAWKQCTSLMTALLPQWRGRNRLPESPQDYHLPPVRRSNRLPPILIQFRDADTNSAGTGSWTSESPYADGERLWNRSVPSYRSWNAERKTTFPTNLRSGFHHCDLDIILAAFWRIRDADSVDVQLPPSPSTLDDQPWTVDEALRRLDLFTKHNMPFGCDPRGTGCLDDDDYILSNEDSMHLWLDYLLDDLGGPTAPFLRRQRYQNWCDEYEYLVGRRINGFYQPKRLSQWYPEKDVVGSPLGLVPNHLIEMIGRAFRDRFWAGWMETGNLEMPRNSEPSGEHFDREASTINHMNQVNGHIYLRGPGGPQDGWELTWPEGLPQMSALHPAVGNGLREPHPQRDQPLELFVPESWGNITNGDLHGRIRWETCGECQDARCRWEEEQEERDMHANDDWDVPY
ncbi:uncharacterized protein A1O5_09711 [Cladophialophora psammophila CBS 110553]|uniref:Uncharacterized protein n=1 Tax=Cladophialophora psammophila CBS 110553 TaxID=1182543 RepID=W9WPZ3_9EURO|nr:uncharacterized protein A1O5_09711 [Cladophialophora psammophila CBS 110553]EXJ67065.1 hypothetical protein A1O5_09711 [Cladophialophora psammophila CBS 110553]